VVNTTVYLPDGTKQEVDPPFRFTTDAGGKLAINQQDSNFEKFIRWIEGTIRAQIEDEIAKQKGH
jgi:hypothetical protein